MITKPLVLDSKTVCADFLSIGQLVEDAVIRIDTGIEVGKMAYGTGNIPFIRTSDISNWELKSDWSYEKQGYTYQVVVNSKEEDQ